MLPRVLSCLLIGCAPSQPAQEPRATIDICTETAFTPHESSQIADAVHAWSKALSGVVQIRPRRVLWLEHDGCRVAIQRVTSTTPWVALRKEEELGYANEVGGTLVWLVADRMPQWLTITAAHEIGHALGLGHTETGLMKPAIMGNEYVTPHEAVWAAYLLGSASKTTVRVQQ